MGEWFSGLSVLEQIFLFCAVLGGLLFLIRLILLFAGGDTDLAEDLPDDIPDDIGAGDAAMGDSDVSFKLISFQGITAFFMIFGLVGLAFKRTSTGDDVQALVFASAGGVGMMFLQAKLMTYLLKLQSSGTLNMQRALGQEGTVYLTIPAEGTGKAQVVVQNRLKVFDAISQAKEELPTGERIKVVAVTGGSILVVERLASE